MATNTITTYIKEMTAAYKKVSKEGHKVQDLMEELISLEKEFVNSLLQNNKLAHSLSVFMDYFLANKDLRSIKSYFRERESAFDDTFNNYLREKNYVALATKYNLNFLFCSFVAENVKINKKLMSLYLKLKEIREKIIVLHLHYALNRAKLFTKYVNNIFNFNDFVSVATEGLIVAVDKYCIDDTKTKPTPFYIVAIGRMISHLIAAQATSSPVKITYKPARQLYTIKKFLDENPNASYEDAAAYMGMDVAEVIFLLHATQLITLHDTVESHGGNCENKQFLDVLPDERSDSYFIQAENKFLIQQAKRVFDSQLPLIEKKVFWIMGMDFGQFDDKVLQDLLDN